MLLVVDVGNTNIAVGAFAGNELKGSWRLNTEIGKTSDEYGVQIAGFLQHAGLDVSRCENIIISSVVPTLARAVHEIATKYLGHTPILVDPRAVPGVKVEIDRPEEVGADRGGEYGGGICAARRPLHRNRLRYRDDFRRGLRGG